jgi:predicted DCC family thiol-disulfide oxidoreductase YuxK
MKQIVDRGLYVWFNGKCSVCRLFCGAVHTCAWMDTKPHDDHKSVLSFKYQLSVLSLIQSQPECE